MARDKSLIERRNTDLYQRFLKLYGSEKYEDVVRQLAYEFYLNPETVFRIIPRIAKEYEKEKIGDVSKD